MDNTLMPPSFTRTLRLKGKAECYPWLNAAAIEVTGEYAGRRVAVVSERYSTCACSGCGSLTGPASLDVNAARNILLSGSGDRASVRERACRLRKRRRATGTENDEDKGKSTRLWSQH